MKMNLLRIVFLALMTSSQAHADDANGLDTESIDAIVAELLGESKAPGISVAVGTNNELRFAKGYGLADLENNLPVTDETCFRTASIAKPLTAVLVLSLAERGAIDPDAPVQTYVPEFPEKQWPITSRQLLGHLGGVRHYQSDTESLSTDHYTSVTEALKVFADDPLRHEPGTKYLYSTFGFNLLGAIAEGAAETSFMELLHQHVIEPSGMLRTLEDSQSAIIPGRTRGYSRSSSLRANRLRAARQGIAASANEDKILNAPLHDTSMKIPGGGLLSTPSDLVRFAFAVNTGKLLRQETVQQMWTRQQMKDGASTNYGLGWQLSQHAGRKMVSHSGGQSGTSTLLILFPETGTSVAIMCNLQNTSLVATAKRIADLVQPPHAKENDFSQAIEKLRTAIEYEMVAKQLPALSLTLVEGTRTVWADGFGFLDAEQSIPATADTVYRVGSVSKPVTCLAVMQAVEEGLIDLDAPISTYLPTFLPLNPENRSRIDRPQTLRQMMSHRSGLVRETPVGSYFDPSQPTLTATVASLNNTELVYRPGTRTKYSNAALAVVGSVLEQVRSSNHPQIVQQRIFEPLEMSQSSFVNSATLESNLATGWMRTYDGRRFEAPNFLLGTGPAGNMYSTVNDLAKFLKCLLNEGRSARGQIVQPETLQAMTTPERDPAGNPLEYGIGFRVQSFDGYQKIGHGGAVYGFSTQMEAIPERQLGIAICTSLDVSNGILSRLADYAFRLMMSAQDNQPLPDYPTTVLVPAERTWELIGSYRNTETQEVTRIIELAGVVRMQRGPFQYHLRSTAGDGRIIADDVVGAGWEVHLESVDRLVVDSVAYDRLPDQAPPDVAGHWKGLIGEYGWDHNTLYILEEAGQLTALIEWLFYYPLKQIDEDTYQFPNYGLYHGEGLKFVRDSSGKATHVIAAEVRFDRRPVGFNDETTFQIRPIRPLDELQVEALAVTPPEESGEFRKSELCELVTLDSSLKLDIRYATKNNFAGAVFYQQPRAFLQKPAAEAVARVHAKLKDRGLGLLIHDAYRPWYVTKMFWEATPQELRDFVANPARGSRHNRGCAVDLTLFDLASGAPIEMASGYDEFTPRAYALYPGGTSRQRYYRDLLRRSMESEGFAVYELEWWHFDYNLWKEYGLQNVTFESLAP